MIDSILAKTAAIPAGSVPTWSFIAPPSRTSGYRTRRQNPHQDIPPFIRVDQADLDAHALPYNVLIGSDTSEHPDIPYIVDFAYDVTSLLRKRQSRSGIVVTKTMRVSLPPGSMICFQDAVHFGVENNLAPRFHLEVECPNYPPVNYSKAPLPSNETYDLPLYTRNAQDFEGITGLDLRPV